MSLGDWCQVFQATMTVSSLSFTLPRHFDHWRWAHEAVS